MEYNYSTSLPTLFFALPAWEKLQTFLRISPVEVSGFGRVVPFQGRHFLVDEIYLVEQEVTSGSTEMNAEDVGRFAWQLAEQGIDISQLKLWWHSHVDMGLFWSVTDDRTMHDLTTDYFFGLVGLRNGQVKVRLNVANPQLVLDDLQNQILYSLGSSYEEILHEYEEKVKIKKIPSSTVSDDPQVATPTRKRGSRRGRVREQVTTARPLAIFQESLGQAQNDISVVRATNGHIDLEGYEGWAVK